MQKKRMFTMKIVDTDAFLDMPLTTQCLYFHLCMRADDDGFVGNPKRIAGYINATTDDLKLLVAKRFVIQFDDGVMVIKHWRMHNNLSRDRYQETNFTDDKALLRLKRNGSYSLTDGDPLDDSRKVEKSGRQDVPKLIDAQKTQQRRTKDATETQQRRTKDAQKTHSDLGLDLDIDLDTDLDNKSVAHTDIFEGLGDDLRDAVSDWISYKTERRQAYKPVGLKNLMSQIRKNASIFGEKAVSDVIRTSMGCNYSGIVFDRLKAKNGTTKDKLDESYDMMQRWADG